MNLIYFGLLASILVFENQRICDLRFQMKGIMTSDELRFSAGFWASLWYEGHIFMYKAPHKYIYN